MDNRLIACVSIVGLAWFVRNTFLGFETSDTSGHEMEEIFRQIAEEQGKTAVHHRILTLFRKVREMEREGERTERERICGQHKGNNHEHAYEEEEGKTTTFTEDLAEGVCYEVLDSLDYNNYSKDFVRREIVLVSEDGHVDDNNFEANSMFGPGPPVMSAVLSHPIGATKYFKTEKWRLCPTLFSHGTYEFLMIENLFVWRPLARKGSHHYKILHLGINGGQSHMFIRAVYPNIRQTIVESDGTLLKLAKKWMKTVELNEDVISDENNNFLQDSEDNQYDSVWVHGCSMNDENVYECPSKKYLQASNLRKIKSVLNENGVVMFRYQSVLKMRKKHEPDEDDFSPSIITRTITELETIFENCSLEDRLGDLELIILCSDQEFPNDRIETIAQNRQSIFDKFKQADV